MHTDTSRTRAVHAARRRSERERYGPEHRALRQTLAPFVAAGLATCARCLEPIEASDPWDLGHDDLDHTKWTGPEHASCNRAAPNRLRTSRSW
jgi:hypothetical protein